MKRPNTRSLIARENRGVVSRDRGIALITTLMLLALLGAASVAITLLVSSDTMINGYYRNYRGSFYAADSGVTIVSEVLKNSISAAATNANPPLPTGSLPASVTSAYAPFQANYSKIGDTGSWNGQFKLISAVVGNPQPLGGAAQPYCSADTPADLAANVNVTCNYLYPYDVIVNGVSSGNENEQIEEKGTIHFASFSGSPGNAGLPSFAKWGAFITNFPGCSSNPGGLVPGTMNGPFFTDTQWDFGNFSNPGYTFNGSVGQVGSQPDWISSSGSCSPSSTAPRGFTAPKFNAGFQTSQNAVTPPSDSYSQAQAVLDGVGAETTAAAFQTAASTELKTVGGTTYPASGTVPNGVYIPTYTNSSNQPAYGGPGGSPAGGFYVQGDASVTLSATTDGGNNPTQTYTISQTSGRTTTTTTIVVDVATNSTTVTQGSGRSAVSETLSGVPTQPGVTENDPSGAAVNPTMVYVGGNITALSGTVQNNTGITVTALDNIQVTGNLTYSSQPVSTPADTLVSNTNAGVLGVYTTANINLAPSSGSSLTTDASLAALSGQAVGTGTSGFCTSSSISSCSPNESNFTWTIVGGRAEDEAHSVNLSQSTTYYDQRFASGTFGPPWFPTAQPQPGAPSTPATAGVTVSRTSWAELNRQ